MKHTINLVADTEVEVTLSGAMNYLLITQPSGTEPVYVDTVTGIAVGDARAIMAPAKAMRQTPYQFDRVESLFVICAAAAVLIVEELEAFNSPIRKTAADGVVTDFNFNTEAKTFEITNFGSGDIYFSVNRDPDSSEEYTRKLISESSYCPKYDVPAKSIRVLSSGANEVEVIGYPKSDPINKYSKR